MLKVKIPFLLTALLLTALFIVSCTKEITVSTCDSGTTKLDGVCVRKDIADYVCCVRSLATNLTSNRSHKLSADAGYTAIKASVARDVSEQLEKKYTASDKAIMAIIEQCNKFSGIESGDSQKQAIAKTNNLTPANPVKSTTPPSLVGLWKIETWKEAGGDNNIGNLVINDQMQGVLTIKAGADGRRITENIDIKINGNCIVMEGTVEKKFHWKADRFTLQIHDDRLEGMNIDEAGETCDVTFRKVH